MVSEKKKPLGWEFYAPRKEWICECGVGHYDPRLVENTIHGCCGCCGRSDFPGRIDTEEDLKQEGNA